MFKIGDKVKVIKGASRRFKPYVGRITAQMGSGSVHLIQPIGGRSAFNLQWVTSDRLESTD